jgi:hypothetical protein
VTAPAPPPTFSVFNLSDTADTNVGDGHCDTDGNLANGDQCTLRAAIQEINFAGTGSITFNVNLLLNNVITLNSALPDINSDLAITGPGADILTIQRNPSASTPEFRILTIDAGKSVTISGLTVTGGKPSSTAPSIGGGILNLGSLTINASKITANSAEGIHNNDTLTVNNCSVLGNSGGGVTSYFISGQQTNVGGVSNLTVTNSLISGNGGLGGINCSGSLGAVSNCTINGSTISGNSSPFGWGGAISNGAGDLSSSATMSIDRSTISGNDTTDTAGGVYNIAS